MNEEKQTNRVVWFLFIFLVILVFLFFWNRGKKEGDEVQPIRENVVKMEEEEIVPFYACGLDEKCS